jgi:RNA polymerase sigma factor (sigma-70 family)
MARRTAAVVARAVRSVSPELAALSDRDLLKRFADDGDQAAFAAVVTRHTAMVLGVCKRVLHSPADAEDATQAVFLVLAKKAKGTRWQASAANWLYTTARKVAHNARLSAERRSKRERRAAVPEAANPADALSGRELIAALDDELDKLTARYREPLVLCYLEGLTRDEAAARLKLAVPALNKQLERGRKKLADALAARGCALGVLLLAVASTSSAGASPPQLHESILAATGGTPSESVAALAQGVVMNGLFMRTRLAVLTVIGLTAVGFGAAFALAADPPNAEKMEKPKAEAKPEAKSDNGKPRTITGTVVGPDGRPVVAELHMHWAEGAVQPLGRTNADGKFEVTVPLHKEGVGGELVATAAGFGPDFHHHGYDWLPASVTPAATLTFKLPKERVVKGRIINQEGKPVAGAKVAVFSVAAYDSGASLDAHLKRWAERADGNPLGGDRGMQYSKAVRPPAATTDADGRFELGGFGAGQVVQLKVSGDGIAVKGLACVNRDGFDPAPLIQTAIRNAPKYRKFNARWLPCGPDLAVVVEPEKLIRGAVTDHDGRPRAGVKVSATRTTSTELTDHWYWHTAITDADGKYEIRGVRKYPEYMVEVDGDPKTGQLPSHASTKDTVGYEPIVLDTKSERGVVVTGTVTDKATGRPIRGSVNATVIAKNPFVRQYPTFLQPGSSGESSAWADPDGRFRLVTIPGPVLLRVRGGGKDDSEYKPPVADPDYPQYFMERDSSLVFTSYRTEMEHLNGCWCKVLNATSGGEEVAVKVELEPATRTPVKVVNADGKPVTGTTATGVKHKEIAHPTDFPDTDTLTVLNLESKKERLLAVFHEKRKLVGTLTLTADTKNPVVMLDRSGTITGRAIGKDGKPLVGLTVTATFTRRQATEAFNAFHKGDFPTTDANGEFRIDGLFPGQEFKLFYTRNKRSYGLEVDPTPAYTLAEPGEVRKVGEMVLLIDHK